MWNQPYLETCCRSALHRLYLCGEAGRPAGQMDQACLMRLSQMGFCSPAEAGRFLISPDGLRRHQIEILPTVRTGAR